MSIFDRMRSCHKMRFRMFIFESWVFVPLVTIYIHASRFDSSHVADGLYVAACTPTIYLPHGGRMLRVSFRSTVDMLLVC